MEEGRVEFAAGPSPLDLGQASPKQKQTRKKKSRMVRRECWRPRSRGQLHGPAHSAGWRSSLLKPPPI
jgi:hypothetical protein